MCQPCHQKVDTVGSVNCFTLNEQTANIWLLYTHIQCQFKTEHSRDIPLNSSNCQDGSKMGHWLTEQKYFMSNGNFTMNDYQFNYPFYFIQFNTSLEMDIAILCRYFKEKIMLYPILTSIYIEVARVQCSWYSNLLWAGQFRV